MTASPRMDQTTSLPAEEVARRLARALAQRGVDQHPYGPLHVCACRGQDGEGYLQIQGYLSPAAGQMLAELLAGAGS